MTRYAVIFDLDGLLANTEPIWSESTQLLLSRRGKTFDPALKPRFMGRHPLEVAGLLAAHYGLQQSAADLLEERLAILRQLYAERPIALMWQEERLKIERILAEWNTPRSKHFRIITQNELVFELVYKIGNDEWQVIRL